ncbi:MAG: twin-arginine translocase TatA/TatE family subunit [Candidatus Binataceae bacterium]|nr:twin-arginine translocase TatA/TatE family subunit [Candidatus Binataceae bacterium]
MEIIVILVIALIVIPPDNLPDVMRGVGKILRELRLASNMVVRELSGVIDEPAAARPARAVNPMADAIRPAAAAVPPPSATMRPAAAAESAQAGTSADPTAPR